jgi:O-antigen/teichoic acid export membrane protein
MRGSALAVFQRLAGAALGFVFQFLVARHLGADGAGIFFLAFTVATVVSILCRGGLELAAVRFVASRIALNDHAGARAIYFQVLRRAVVFSALGTVFTAAVAWPLAERVFGKPAAAPGIAIMSLCIAPIVLYRLHGESLRGLGRIGLSQFLINLAVPLAAIALLPLLAPRFGIEGALASQIAAHAIAAAVGVVAVRAAFSKLPNEGPSNFDFDELDRAFLPLYQLSVLNLLQSSVATLALGALVTDAEVGVYGVCHSVSLFLQLILLGHNALLGPEFAALHARGDTRGIHELARRATRRMTLEALPVFLLCVVAPGWVLGFFGDAFESGATCLRILAVGQLVNVATGSVGLLLVMSGHERSFRNVVFAALLVNVTANAILAPRYGIEGAAIATAAGVILQNVAAMWMVKRKLGFFAS